MTQNQIILKHLQKKGYISTFESYDLYGITRLSARISEIRKMGYNIASVSQKGTNRYGEKIRFCRYTLMPKISKKEI